MIIKVTCYNNTNFPLDDKKREICQLIEDSKLFIYVGKSRIDGNNMYKLKDISRLIKINKLYKKDNRLSDKLDNLLFIIDNYISYIGELI